MKQEAVPNQELDEELVQAEDQEVEESEDESEDDAPQQEPIEEQYKRAYESEKMLHNKARREAFQQVNRIRELEAQLARKEEEKAQLRYTNEVTTQSAYGGYEAAAKERMDRAKDMYTAAYESADPKAIADANEIMHKAVYEFERIKSIKAEQEAIKKNEHELEQARLQAQAQYQQQNPSQYPSKPTLNQEQYSYAENWVAQNDWFKVNGPNYDAEKHAIADQACAMLDAWCYQNNRAHEIATPAYFAEIDRYLEQVYTMPGTNQITPRPPQAQQQQYAPQRGVPVKNVVAPARGSVGTMPNGAPQRGQKSPLSPEQRNFVRNLGVSEEEFRAAKKRSDKTDYFGQMMDQARDRGGY